MKKQIFWLIIVLAFILRFYKLGEIPLSLNWDEVSNTYNAYSILKTGRDENGSFLPLTNRSFDDYKPPLYMYLNTITVGMFSLSSFAARLPSAFFGFLSIPLIYFLTKLIFEKSKKKESIALLSMFLFSIFPWHLQFSRVGLEANIGLFTSTAFLAIFLYGLKKYVYLIIAALLFGVGIYSYHAQRIFMPLFLIILAYLFRREIAQIPKKFTLPFIFISIVAILSLFIFLPQKTIFSRLESSSVISEENQKMEPTNLRAVTANNFVNNKYINVGSRYIGNYLSHFAPNFLFIEGDENLRHHIENNGMLPLFYLPIFLAGFYLLFRNPNKINSILIIWLMLAPLPAAPATPTPHAIRSSLMIIPIVIISAFGFASIIYRIHKIRAAILGSGLLIAFSLTIYLHNYYTHYSIHSVKDWQFGYKEAAIESERLKSNFEKISVSEDFEQAHIFWLYYTQYDPESFQKYGSRGQFDKFYFGQKKFEVELSKNKSELYVSYANTFPSGFKVLKTIYYPDGTEAVKIGSYEEK